MVLTQSAPLETETPPEAEPEAVIGFPHLLSYDYMKTDDGYEYRYVSFMLVS